jgi:hypothetical protein
MVKRKTRDERSNEMGLFRKAETCSEEQSTPRHKISKPVFGCELFVAQINLCTPRLNFQRELFTSVAPTSKSAVARVSKPACC